MLRTRPTSRKYSLQCRRFDYKAEWFPAVTTATFGKCDTFALNHLAVYCTCTGPMNGLELYCCKTLSFFAIKHNQIINAKALFRNVKQVLILTNSSAIDGGLLSDAKKLIRFELIWLYAKDVNKFLWNDYPNLRSLTSYPEKLARKNNADANWVHGAADFNQKWFCMEPIDRSGSSRLKMETQAIDC